LHFFMGGSDAKPTVHPHRNLHPSPFGPSSPRNPENPGARLQFARLRADACCVTAHPSLPRRARRVVRVRAARLAGVLAIAAVVLASALGAGAGAATTTTIVTATVPSSTLLDPSGCATGTANVTVLPVTNPGVATVTSTDCVVKFGSSNDTSMLKLYQADGVGTAMTEDAWTALASTGQWLNAVAPVGDQTAYASGNGGVMLKSTNGGTSWTTYAAAATGVTQNLFDVVAVDASTAWAVGAAGNITKTTNAGTSWTPQTTGAAVLGGVDAVNATTAWAVGSGGVVLATTNGTAWAAQTSNTAQTLLEVDAVSSSIAWAVGNAGAVIRTIDGGTTWVVKTAPSASNVRTVFAIDSNVAVVGSADGKFYRTTNGGTSWTPVLDVTASTNGHDLAGTPDGSVIWAIGDVRLGGNAVVYRSLDGGVTWTDKSFPASQNLRGVGVGNATTAWIVGDSNLAYRTPTSSIPDYSAGVNWTSAGPSFFGACLSSATLGASTGATTWTPNAGCTASDGAWWKPIAATSPTIGAKVAEALAPDNDLLPDATVRMRFVFHPSISQASGTYTAPLIFETVAPNAAS
jgi:photosystem II stability/assembly factor-like uncharacterized protein